MIMNSKSRHWAAEAGLLSLRIVAFLALLVTLLPLLKTGQWYVRVWEFPRLQIVLILLFLLVVCGIIAFTKRWKTEFRIWSILLLAAFGWQLSHLLPFTPLWTTQVPTAVSSQTNSPLRILVVNLKFENQEYTEVTNVINEHAPDILLLMEVDQPWFEGLHGLAAQFPYQENVIEDDGLGMCLWSRNEITMAERKYLVSERRVSIWATISTPSGNIQFIGVHPTPPGLQDETGEARRDSRVRDAELVTIAKEISQHDNQRWIVAGDFNDVAWSHTTRLFQRLSGMGDPRVGRNFLGTFHSQYPVIRMPIDHVFLSSGFSLKSMDRVYIPGSDHFGVTVDVYQNNQANENVPTTEGNDREEANEIVEEGEKDAAQRNVGDNTSN